MRLKSSRNISDYKILILDDEQGILDTVSAMLRRSGYESTGVTDPLEAIEIVRNGQFDLLILDFLMQPIHGDAVVKQIREFNNELYILLLTGHKDLAPPLETIKALEIQGYCEKGDRFDQLLLLVESGIKSISQMRTIKKFKDGLNKILEAVPKIYQLQPIGNILEDILTELMHFVDSTSAFILVDDIMEISEEKKSIFRGIGKYNEDISRFMDMLSPDFIENIGMVRNSKKVMQVNGGAVFPLINDNHETIGVIFIESLNLDDGLKLLEIYASQAGTSINNAFLHSLVNTKNDELNRTYDMLKVRYMDTIEALRQAVDAKDVYTRGHSDRVSYYSVKLGELFKLPWAQLEMLRIGGIFHDVGKISTTDDILLKNDKLNTFEYEEIKKHPLKGANILSAVSMFRDIVPLVKYHHERIDGRGYPEGLKGEEIPLLARIISVADAFDAMTSDRHYRMRFNLDEAKKQLIEGSGTQFDSMVVEKFILLLEDYKQITSEIAATF